MKTGLLEELIHEMLRRMYAEADPPADWDKITEQCEKERSPDFKGKKKYTNKGSEWYMEHKLSYKRQEEIRKEVFKRRRLSRLEENQIGMAFLMWSPTSRG